MKKSMSVRQITNMLLLVYLIIKPIYVFKSGVPQPADFIIVILFIFLLVNKKIRFNKLNTKIIAILFLFVMYSFIINLYWITIYPNDIGRFVKNSIFHSFNLIATLSIFGVYEVNKTNENKFFLVVSKGILISIFIQFISIIVGGKVGSRVTGNFNNPNQLAYYGLITYTYLRIFNTKYKNKSIYFVALCMSSYFMVISMSRATIITLVILIILELVIYFFSIKSISLKKMRNLIIVIIGLFSVGIVISNYEIKILNDIAYRFESKAEKGDSNLYYGRGYGRIIEGSKDIIWGNGEGAYYRYSILTGLEVHSTLVSILVCYGIIGFLIFIYYLYKTIFIKNIFIRKKLYLTIGIFIYWMSHNGIRNTLIFVLFTVIYIYGDVIKNTNIKKSNVNLCIK